MDKNLLFYGDNLEVLRRDIPNASVDLVYLDPPFNSNRSFNVLFASKSGDEAQAQIEAFDDTWTWSHEAEAAYDEMLQGGTVPPKVADTIEGMRRLLGDNDVLAYLVMMTPRLVELHRALKSTGSLYLHCDPTASHYLKILLDAIFGPKMFRNEIAWQRSGAKNDPRRYGRSHDTIFFYTKSNDFTWSPLYTPFTGESIKKNYTHTEAETGRRYRRGDLTAAKPGGDVDYEWEGVRPYKGRHWAYSRDKMDAMLAEGRIEFRSTGMPVYKRYLDEQPGVPLQDVWTDIRLTSADPERLGYPTQKPESLLERIIRSSTNEVDVVLDPFCGCGTTVAVAQRLRRRWIGIDITFLAVDLISKRLIDTHGEEVAETYETHGIPRDLAGAKALFHEDPFDFERWAVSLVDAQPNLRQVGDKGADGVIRFSLDGAKGIGRVLVSVKGGGQMNPGMVRDLAGTVSSQRAEMGLFVCLEKPTRGMVDAAQHAGTFVWPFNGRTYPKVQIATVADLLSGKKPELPPAYLPYVQARRMAVGEQQSLL